MLVSSAVLLVISKASSFIKELREETEKSKQDIRDEHEKSKKKAGERDLLAKSKTEGGLNDGNGSGT